jgi:hypothetical protein
LQERQYASGGGSRRRTGTAMGKRHTQGMRRLAGNTAGCRLLQRKGPQERREGGTRAPDAETAVLAALVAAARSSDVASAHGLMGGGGGGRRSEGQCGHSIIAVRHPMDGFVARQSRRHRSAMFPSAPLSCSAAEQLTTEPPRRRDVKGEVSEEQGCPSHTLPVCVSPCADRPSCDCE